MNQRRSNPTETDSELDATAVPLFWPEENQVRIRMYGQGLGDCFLLAFPRSRPTDAVPMGNDMRPVYVLIDCGVISETTDASARMKRIVRDIRLTTQDDNLLDGDGEPMGRLDLLIITNGHWDHISGFSEASEEWQGIQVDALWTAWTERRDSDEVAGVLCRVTDKQRKALAQVANLAGRADLDDRLGLAVRLASFLTAAPASGESVDGEPVVPTNISAIAKQLKIGDNWTTCEPGDVRRIPGTRAQSYVLGPPRNWDRLQPINPKSQTQRPAEEQPTGSTGSSKERLNAYIDPALPIRRYVDEPSSLNAVVMPLLGPPAVGTNGAETEADLADRDVYERTFPFNRLLRVPLPAAELAATRDPAPHQALASYFDDVSHWRRIDNDWLVGVESFALQVDNLINNTSLVLAIELPPPAVGSEAKVLLFVSDAQAGNWISWDEIAAWQPRDGARATQTRPDVADFLRRTVFYKVGHHGAENATPKEQGIDRLRNDGALTAFVPAFAPPSEKDGMKLKRWPNLPRREVMDALNARTGSRVVLSDGTIWDCSERLERARRHVGLEVSPQTLVQEARDEDGEVWVLENPLWVQMTIDY